MSDKKDKLARLASVISLVAASASAYFAWSANQISASNQAKQNRAEARELLDIALDKMGDTVGASSIVVGSGALSPAESSLYESARRNIRRANDLAPDFYLVHHYNGLYLQRLGREEEAKQSLQQAIQLLEDAGNEEDWWPYADLAYVFELSDDSAQAAAYYQKALAIDERDPRLRANYARYFERTGSATSAHEQWCKAHEYRDYIREPLQLPQGLNCE